MNILQNTNFKMSNLRLAVLIKVVLIKKSVALGASIPLSTEGGFAENPPSKISIFKINGLLIPP